MLNIARSVRFPIQKRKKAEFTKLFNDELIPILKAHDGFKNEIMMVNDDHVVGVSVWKSSDELNRYASTVYPKLEAKLLTLMTGKPQIETFELTARAAPRTWCTPRHPVSHRRRDGRVPLGVRRR